VKGTSSRLLDDLIPVERVSKPRESGITIATDPFGSVDNELLEEIAEHIDIIEIGESATILADRSKLQKRVKKYHDLGIRVLGGGTLLQVATQKDVILQVLQRIRSVGFDSVLIRETAGQIPSQQKAQLLEWASRHSLDCIFEVGLVGALGQSASSPIASIHSAFELKSRRVIVDLGPGSTSEPIPFDTLDEIVGQFGPPHLVFRAPKVHQRTALILEFGSEVNLVGVPVDEVHYLEIQRLGFASETLGLSRPVQSVEGSPAAKFIYHLIRSEHPVDQTTLLLRSGLPKRTVQGALRYLVANGFVRTVSEASDMRRHTYTLG
jgi:phosphosulfolactate synthase